MTSGRQIAKGALIKIGARLSPTALNRLTSTLNYLYTGRWMRDHNFSAPVRVNDRMQLIAVVAGPIAEQEVLYLEFGVWKGDATRRWSQLLKNKNSRLHGFDSFEGLPEDWNDEMKSGHFSTSGVPPDIPDSRVKFFIGRFEQTLPTYQFVDSPVLVIYLDADLYSSTNFVLKALKNHIKVGTIICCDDFWDRHHEQRAFDEFLRETGITVELIASDYGMRRVAFRRIK
jgi:macrocin-O-methyltransferase TylF-like protien